MKFKSGKTQMSGHAENGNSNYWAKIH